MEWINFLEDNGVAYVTRGPNTRKGEVSIRCPYCGDEDPSEHMGISLATENWGCHRNAQHRGKAAYRLIQGVLGCSWGQAKLVAGQYSRADPETLVDALLLLEPLSEAPRAVKAPPVEWPVCRPIRPTGLTAKFWRYLEKRGFDKVQALIDQYDLSCSMVGKYKDRIIIPFYQKYEQIGWTSRALIDPINAPRYLSSDAAIKQTIFNEDELEFGGKILVLVEGPFDALKLDFYGQRFGVRATCVFGTSMSLEQIVLLAKLCKRFQKVVILFDHNAVEPSFMANDWLTAPNVSVGQLPPNMKDPGAMSKVQIEHLAERLKNG